MKHRVVDHGGMATATSSLSPLISAAQMYACKSVCVKQVLLNK